MVGQIVNQVVLITLLKSGIEAINLGLTFRKTQLIYDYFYELKQYPLYWYRREWD